MSNLCQELANFAVETKWEDLPAPVVREAKFILLDSIGCALAAIPTDPAKMAISLARKLGGPSESSIIGVGDRVSCSGAAFANGQLINALDYDASTPGGHTPPYVIPPALAMAESTGASGKDLILAIVLGFELTARLAEAMPDNMMMRFSQLQRHGFSNCSFGAAIGAGKLLKLDQEKMSNALGIVGHLCQVLTLVKFTCSDPRAMTKYGVPGWQNTGGIMAALLAEMGFMGDTNVFDPEHGFWKFCGYEEGYPNNKITEGIGKTWNFIKANYKQYPCCFHTHAPLDCFFSIINQDNLQPQDIESVKVLGHPNFDAPVFRNRKLTSIVDIQFGVPYVFSLAAHRVRIGAEWQDWDTVTDPKILEFAKKVSYQGHPEFGEKQSAVVEVVAKGKTFREEKEYALTRGSAGTEFQLTYEELEAKYRHNASRILTEDKIEGSVRSLLELETLENVSALMEQVTLT
jgi:2-methylcitrate dehydratase PrpD